MANHHRRPYPRMQNRKAYFSEDEWQRIFTDASYGMFKDVVALFYQYECRYHIIHKHFCAASNADTQWRKQHPGTPTKEMPQDIWEASRLWGSRQAAMYLCMNVLDDTARNFRRKPLLSAVNPLVAQYLEDILLPKIENYLHSMGTAFPFEWKHPEKTHKRKQSKRTDYNAVQRRQFLHLKADIEELLARWKYPNWRLETRQRTYSPHNGRLREPPHHPKKLRTVRKILARPRQPGEGVFMGGHLDS